ncbi:MAG: hypothetical protein WBM04_01010 [Candidatus Korobacteraceae bacterium]
MDLDTAKVPGSSQQTASLTAAGRQQLEKYKENRLSTAINLVVESTRGRMRWKEHFRMAMVTLFRRRREQPGWATSCSFILSSKLPILPPVDIGIVRV